MDGILLPPIYATDLPIVFVEVQGYKDTKKVVYSSLFSEIFLYLHDYQPVNDWCAVLIFIKRSLDPRLPIQYEDFADSPRFIRIYLDELEAKPNQSLGLSLLQLISLRKEIATESARELVKRTRQLQDAEKQRKFIQLIETVFVYKFPNLGREEIEAMLGLSELKQTRVYQEAFEEGKEEGQQAGELRGKLAAVPLLLQAGISVEQIAEQLSLDLETVRQVVREQ